MTSSGDTNTSDLVQAVPSGSKVQGVVESLKEYFDPESIAEGRGYSKVECSYDESKALDEVRSEFKNEFLKSKKITDIISAVVRLPGKTLYLLRGVTLLVFQSEWSNIEKIVSKDNCAILIPVVVDGSVEAILEEQPNGRRTTFTFKANCEILITGQSSIWLPAQSKVVCVVLVAGKDKG